MCDEKRYHQKTSDDVAAKAQQLQFVHQGRGMAAVVSFLFLEFLGGEHPEISCFFVGESFCI